MTGYDFDITAMTPDGSRYALCNLIDCSKTNGIFSLYEIVASTHCDMHETLRKFNSYDYVYGTYEPFRLFDRGFILRMLRNGTKVFVTVTKEV